MSLHRCVVSDCLTMLERAIYYRDQVLALSRTHDIIRAEAIIDYKYVVPLGECEYSSSQGQTPSRSLRPCNRIPVAIGTLNESTPSSIPIRIRWAQAWIVASDTPADSFPRTQHQECDT